jgi:hypothetical protein
MINNTNICCDKNKQKSIAMEYSCDACCIGIRFQLKNDKWVVEEYDISDRSPAPTCDMFRFSHKMSLKPCKYGMRSATETEIQKMLTGKIVPFTSCHEHVTVTRKFVSIDFKKDIVANYR